MTLSQSLMMCPGLLMKLELNNPGGNHKYAQRGIYIGNSSAGCLAVARRLHRKVDHRDTLVACIAYDGGYWYSDITATFSNLTS